MLRIIYGDNLVILFILYCKRFTPEIKKNTQICIGWGNKKREEKKSQHFVGKNRGYYLLVIIPGDLNHKWLQIKELQ